MGEHTATEIQQSLRHDFVVGLGRLESSKPGFKPRGVGPNMFKPGQAKGTGLEGSEGVQCLVADTE